GPGSAPGDEVELRSQVEAVREARLDALTRRSFLQLAAASAAAAGLGTLTGCPARPPEEQIIPYVRQPEDIVPGKPLFYASALAGVGGYAIGVLVETHEGRPTKLEGNPLHPSSLGATDAQTQAQIRTL